MRRQMRDRALAGLDKLEVLQRSAMSGGLLLSAPSVAGDMPAPSEAGGAAPGTEEGEFQYQPTKVIETAAGGGLYFVAHGLLCDSYSHSVEHSSLASCTHICPLPHTLPGSAAAIAVAACQL